VVKTGQGWLGCCDPKTEPKEFGPNKFGLFMLHFLGAYAI